MKHKLIGLSAMVFLAVFLLVTGSEGLGAAADYSIKKEMPANTKFKVAAVQFFAQHKKKEENVRKLLALSEEAAKKGAKIIVTPEMAATGYSWYDRKEIAPFVEEVPGRTTERFAALSQKYGVYILFSLPEVDRPSNVYHNTAVLVGPKGYVGKYRKTHSWVCEPRWAMDGDMGFQVFGTEYGNLAPIICMDADHMETVRSVSLMGADIILYPTAYPGIVCPTDNWFSRTFENGVYFIAANWWGEERGAYMAGGSCILNPDGTIQNWRDIEDGIVYGEVDLKKVRRRQYAATGENKMLDRRPELYHNVVLNTYLMTPGWFFTQFDYEPLPDGAKCVIAAAQFKPVPGNMEANLAAMDRMITQQNKQKKVDLIVFPELATCGSANPDRYAEAIPGPTTEKILELAKKHNVYLVVGMVEKDGMRKYNAAVLVGPEGFIGKYRKTHLDHLDKQWATPGDKIGTFNTKIGRIGILIGYDALFPETHRHLAAWASDIICIPSALSFPVPVGIKGSRAVFDDSMGPIPTGPNPNHWHYFRTIGGANHVYCIFANQYGTVGDQAYMGRSGVFPPEMFFFPLPESIAPSTGNVIVVQDADTTYGVKNPDYNYATNIARSKDYVGWRLPVMYKLIVTPNPAVNSMVIK